MTISTESALINGGAANKDLVIKRLNARQIEIAKTLNLLNVPKVLGDYSTEPLMPLTSEYQIIRGWGNFLDDSGIVYDEESGEFLVAEDGIYYTNIKRVYGNWDRNPSDIVLLHIQGQVNKGTGWEEIFYRTAPVSAATHVTEPAIAPFSTASLLKVYSGTRFRLRVRAEDNGNTPVDTKLLQSKITVFATHNL